MNPFTRFDINPRHTHHADNSGHVGMSLWFLIPFAACYFAPICYIAYVWLTNQGVL